MLNRIKGKLILASMTGVAVVAPTGAQVTGKGLPPAANAYRSYQDASISRDSGLYQPLDLLNDFYPAVAVTLSDHDNVRRRSDFEENDLKLTVNPSLGYRTNLGRHQFYAAYQGSFVFHDEITQEDAESHVVDAKLGLDLTRRWDIELFGAAGNSFEERGISGSRAFSAFRNNGIDSGPEEVNFVSYGADLIFGRKIGILTSVLGYEYNATNFSSRDLRDSTDFSDGRDRSAESVHLDVDWAFADRTSAFARVQKTYVEYERRASGLDSEQVDFLLGLRWKPANDLSGVLGFGTSEKTFDDPRRENFDSSIYYANLNYSFNPFSVLQFSASRSVEEPSSIDADFYQTEVFGLALTHAINTRLVLNLYAKSADDDFNTGREDQFFDWGAELGYAWRNWMTASVYYSESERDSTEEDVPYEDIYYGIRLRADLRSLFRSAGKRKAEPASFGPSRKTKSLSTGG